MSNTRKRYIFRLIGRILVLLICCVMYVTAPEDFEILEGMNFFRSFSLFHLLWMIWVADMIYQIIPIRNKLPLGSMKLFSTVSGPIRDKINYAALRDYVIATIGVLYRYGIVNDMGLFMISVLF